MVFQVHGNFSVPMWIMILCPLIMTLGTMFGGYKTIKSIGMKVSKLEPYQGTASDLAGAGCLFVSTLSGLPVSSTQTKTMAIMGVGASKRLSNVNWNFAKNMVKAWIITFPVCGILGYIATVVFTNIW